MHVLLHSKTNLHEYSFTCYFESSHILCVSHIILFVYSGSFLASGIREPDRTESRSYRTGSDARRQRYQTAPSIHRRQHQKANKC